MSNDIKEQINSGIKKFKDGDLFENTINLFNILGYNTSRQNRFEKNNYNYFKELFFVESFGFREEKARVSEWCKVELIFQLTQAEMSRQAFLFDTSKIDNTIIEAYLFFAIELKKNSYTRTELSGITREINKVFPMPVMLLFKYGEKVTLSVIKRRLHKKDASKDVLEKVTLIKDINLIYPHRAHIEILQDLNFSVLQSNFEFRNFVELHNAWQKTLDSSELNKRFYKELANWYFWAIENVEFPDDVEKNREKRNSVNVIRLLTRIIFVWFLKEKNDLIPAELFNKKKLDDILIYNDKNNSTYYKAILQNLFFATLNSEMNKDNPNSRSFVKRQYGVQEFYRYERFFQDKDAALKIFQNIPFLNGGLFENLDSNVGEPNEIRIDCFSNKLDNEERLKVPDYLFFSEEQNFEELNQIYDTTGKKYYVRGLIQILNKYKFTINENTPVEEEIALDPELLGKVFENLLASYNEETKTTARKLTGSFYTPREIVDYIVEESLLHFLLNKFKDNSSTPPHENLEFDLRQLFSYTEEDHHFNDSDIDIIIEGIDHCKILDPACGSGAFPMGILHKMVFILAKLDPDNERWKQRQINKIYEIPDSTLHENLIGEVEKTFKDNFDDYGRKLYLIENCIYGVDIQPIAVQIAKLRFFISLIVDQKVNRNLKNLGIRALPNLETKFVAADTLIGIEKPSQLSLRNEVIDTKELELREVRERHFSARTPITKKKYREKDKLLRNQLANLLEKDGFNPRETKMMASWNPYDQNIFANFFDPEWMFNIKLGFDIIIGNPPYYQIQKLDDKIKQELQKQNYETYSGGADIYCLFFEKGINLLRLKGILSYISSNRFCFANYGLGLRKYLSKSNILQLINFNEINVFESANVGSLVSVLENEKPNVKDIFVNEVKGELLLEKILLNGNKVNRSFYGHKQWSFEDHSIQSLKQKIESRGISFDKWKGINIKRGITTGANSVFVINTKLKEKLCEEHPSSKTIIKKLLRGRDIKRFTIQWEDNWIIFTRRGIDIDKYPAIKKYLLPYRKELEPGVGRKKGSYKWFEIQDNTAFYPFFDERKLIWTRLSNINAFAISEQKEYSLDSTSFAVGDNLEYLCSILNSKVVFFYFLLGSVIWGKDGIKWFGKYFDSIPIPQISNDQKKIFINIVNIVLEINNSTENNVSNISVRVFEDLIDAMVFELYFEEPIKAANANVLNFVQKYMPDLSVLDDRSAKLIMIESFYKKLKSSNNEIRNRIIKQNIAVDEIKIINQIISKERNANTEDFGTKL